jgi:hypothetical protein
MIAGGIERGNGSSAGRRLENPEAEDRGENGSEGEQSQDVFEHTFGWAKFRDVNNHPWFEVALRTGRPLANELVDVLAIRAG